MQAAVVNVPGEAPDYQSFPDPEPQEGEALVQVRAAGLHPVVKSIASGAHYSATETGPAIPGIDGVGVLPDGRRVYFVFVRKPWGTMAELAAAPVAKFIPVPDSLEDATAAAIANPGMSAWMTLKERAGLVPRRNRAHHGRYGSCRTACHPGRAPSGRKACDRSGPQCGRPRECGRRRDRRLGPAGRRRCAKPLTVETARGIDVVVDYLWGRPTELVLEALAKGFRAEFTRRTRLVEVGSSAGATITLPGAILRSIDLTLLGSGFGAAPLDKILASIPTLFDFGRKTRPDHRC